MASTSGTQDNATLEALDGLPLEITPEQYARIDAAFMAAGRNRLANFREQFSDADFIAGASVVLAALGKSMPVPWYIAGLRGQSLFREARPPQLGRESLVASAILASPDNRYHLHVNAKQKTVEIVTDRHPRYYTTVYTVHYGGWQYNDDDQAAAEYECLDYAAAHNIIISDDATTEET